MVTKEKEPKAVSFDAFIKQQYDGVMISGDTYVDRPRQIIPTVLSLDISLSGGIPEGKVVLFSGKAKGGKSTTCLTIGRNAIAQGRKFFYGDVENRLDPSLMKTIRGLDPKTVTIFKSTLDKILTAEDWFHIFERGVKDNPRSVWVCDSIAMLSTLAEQSEKTGENKDMSGTPKLMASFLRKIKDIVNANDCMMIFVSQFQTNRDPTSHKKFEEKGGLGIQYGCSVWMTLDWFQPWKRDESKEIWGQDLFITIRASALGKPYRPCAVPLRFGEGLDEALDVMNHAENLGLIEKAGAWYSSSLLGEGKWQGADNMRRHLIEHPEQLAVLERQVRKIVLPETVTDADSTTERKDGEAPAQQAPEKKRKK